MPTLFKAGEEEKEGRALINSSLARRGGGRGRKEFIIPRKKPGKNLLPPTSFPLPKRRKESDRDESHFPLLPRTAEFTPKKIQILMDKPPSPLLPPIFALVRNGEKKFVFILFFHFPNQVRAQSSKQGCSTGEHWKGRSGAIEEN